MMSTDDLVPQAVSSQFPSLCGPRRCLIVSACFSDVLFAYQVPQTHTDAFNPPNSTPPIRENLHQHQSGFPMQPYTALRCKYSARPTRNRMVHLASHKNPRCQAPMTTQRYRGQHWRGHSLVTRSSFLAMHGPRAIEAV